MSNNWKWAIGVIVAIPIVYLYGWNVGIEVGKELQKNAPGRAPSTVYECLELGSDGARGGCIDTYFPI